MKAINIEWDIDPNESECGFVLLLPDEISIPEDITGMEGISDYISNITGFCHKGFKLKGWFL